MRALATERGGTSLPSNYTGHRLVLQRQRTMGHRFRASGMAVKSGAWCRACAES